MKELNVMSLAWKIFKADKVSFSFALKWAWKICKRNIKSFEGDNKLIFQGKDIKKENFHINKAKRGIHKIEIGNNPYDLNLFVYQAIRL